MSVNALYQNVEIEYINSMLKVNEITELENNQCTLHEYEYQLVLVSGFNVAILSSDISSIHQAVSYEIIDHVLIYDGNEYNIINIGCLIKPSYEFNHAEQFVILKDKKLALTCERILEKGNIDKEKVCWRDENSQRKWLAGTVKNKNIILLDSASLQNDLIAKNN